MMTQEVHSNEQPLMVFISSRMSEEMEYPRQLAVDTINNLDYGRPWAFEYAPASSEPADRTYLRKVSEADFVLWLVGSETTPAVTDEITTAITYERRLLVFILPFENRDHRTEKLLGYVSDYTKWKEIHTVDDLAVQIKQSLSDELTSALRNPVSPNRRAKLQYERRLSVSRCKTAWLAIGVDDALADEMANDPDLGNRLEFPTPGLHTVVGDQGLGKSLAVERLFQMAIINAIEDSLQPFPVFIRARELKIAVKDYIEQSLEGNADPYNPKVFVVIDGIDEVGPQAGSDIYQLYASQ